VAQLIELVGMLAHDQMEQVDRALHVALGFRR
jgi:hypothetical protein